MKKTVHSDNVRTDICRFIFLGILLSSLCTFGFLDDTSFWTTDPGHKKRRKVSFHGDIQRSFYSEYFAGHDFKVQILTLSNGIFGSIYLT